MMILNEIYKRLELADDCLVRLSDPNWKNKVSFPSRIYRLLETNDLLKDMDAFFYFDNKPLILFLMGLKINKPCTEQYGISMSLQLLS